MIKKLLYKFHILLFTVLFSSVISAQYFEDIYDKYTSVGQLGLTVTNFGVLGNGWNKINGRILPSCQYKQNTEILRDQVEHFSYAGLWIGGVVNGQRLVSTAIVDGVFESGQEGFELSAADNIDIKSSISSTSLDSIAQYFSPYATSHQDLKTAFRDYGTIPTDNMNIPNHTPLGIDIRLESYAWNFSFADAFVILNYSIKNVSDQTIENIYAGIWTDASVANMNYTNKYEPGGGFTWYDNLDGYDTSIDDSEYSRDIAYQYDLDGDDGWAQSYIGITWLGGNVSRPYVQSHYNQWVWTNSNNSSYPVYSMPLTDYERYQKLSSSVQMGTGLEYTSAGYPNEPNSWIFLFSAGPFGSIPTEPDSSAWELPPGDSCNIVMAVVTAKWNGTEDDSPTRRRNLHVNSDWAQRAYNGEDKNRNNILDDGEDLDQDDEIDRYILPEPPPVPNMAVDVDDQVVTVYWQSNAENFIDPISREMDFEGYRIYGARKTVNDSNEEFTLLGEFDLALAEHMGIGYNTGFEYIRIINEFGDQDSVEIDGNVYHYKFVNNHVKNGWLNYYAVTAYDRGDPDANLASLESSVYANRQYVYPGVKPDAANWEGNPSVYPNPYKGQARWDGYGSRAQMIWFSNLPRKAEIRIFTLAGDLVDILDHDQEYQGSDVYNIDEYKTPQLSGGEHAWDLITRDDQAIASGLYLFTVKNLDNESLSYGKVKEGKFLIIK